MLPVNLLNRKGPKEHDLSAMFWTFTALCFVLAMVFQPGVVFQGATSGLKAWWEIVFPSLLPFFIASEILMRLGFVHFIGVLMEPVMRPLFNVPGAGGFVMAIGFTSGFPIGSMVTAELRQKGLCSKTEAERLMSFTNNSSPLFMLTAVAVGMFGRPELGVIIAGAHYLANICLGLCLRFYKRNDKESVFSAPNKWRWPIKQAFQELRRHQRQEHQPVGKLLGEAVASSINKLISIGGFIILFAVIIRLFNEAGIISIMAACLGLLLKPLGFAPDIFTALASGFFEMTIGTKTASEAAASELHRLMAVGMILGWSGLSIHAQVASMIARTDIRMKLFVMTRLAHALLAALFTWILYNSQYINEHPALPALAKTSPDTYSTFSMVLGSLNHMFLLLLLLICISFIYQSIFFIYKTMFKLR